MATGSVISSNVTATVLGRLYRAAQRWATLDVTHLLLLTNDSLRSPSPLPQPWQVMPLHADQIRHFAADPQQQLDASLAGRLHGTRDICLGVLGDGQLAAYAWYALGSIEACHNRGRSPHSGTALEFPDSYAFLYKAYTHPAFRNQGFYKQLNCRALELLSGRGVTGILATTDWSNLAALRSCYGVGFKSLGLLWRAGLGRHVAGCYPRAATRRGIRCGAKVPPRC